VLGGSAARPTLGRDTRKLADVPQLRWSFQHIEELFPDRADFAGLGSVGGFQQQPEPLAESRSSTPTGQIRQWARSSA